MRLAQRSAHGQVGTLRDLLDLASALPCANAAAWDADDDPASLGLEHPAEGDVLCHSECAACRTRVLALSLRRSDACP